MDSLTVHLIRHGRVASHRGDVPLASEGYDEVEQAATKFAGLIQPGECVYLLTTATARSRETANILYRSLSESVLPTGAQVVPPTEEWAIRNPDVIAAGRRVEMVSTGAALAEQLPGSGLSAEDCECLPFFGEFFRHSDRIGFWVGHDNPPGEDAGAVARRVVAWTLSLRDLPEGRPRRYLCVTHSPIMRAVLTRCLLPQDPGEPDWVESIDLAVEAAEARITYRDRSARLALSQ